MKGVGACKWKKENTARKKESTHETAQVIEIKRRKERRKKESIDETTQVIELKRKKERKKVRMKSH